MKKIFGKITMFSLAAILFLGLSTASAASKPIIDDIKNKTDNSVTLKVHYDKYSSKKVDIVVSIRNKDTEKTVKKTFRSKKLSSSGKKDLKVDELLSSTKYSFKIKIKKHSGSGSYSSWSDSSSAKTKS